MSASKMNSELYDLESYVVQGLRSQDGIRTTRQSGSRSSFFGIVSGPSPSVITFDELLAKLEQPSELLGSPVASGRSCAGNGLFALKPEIDAELRKSLPQQRSRPRTIFPPSLAEAIRRIHNGKSVSELF
jgi:hypothetical protein